MEDENLKRAVRDAVLEHLPALEEETVGDLTGFLISLGIEEIAQLRHIKEEDLVPGLSNIQARTLLAGWASKYGEPNNPRGQDQQPSGSRDGRRRTPLKERAQSEDKEWDFTLDWQDIYNISPSVKKTLERGKKLKSKFRRKMIERIVTQVRNKVPHCERKTFIQVMRDMKLKYKTSFRHELAKGVIGKHSLVASMQAKFDNDKRAVKRKSQMEIEAPGNFKAAYGCVRWRVTTLPENETSESLEAKRVELSDIFRTIRPSSWDEEKIKSLMNQTYALQRKDINVQAENLAKLQREAAKKKRSKKNNKNKENTEPETQVGTEPVITTVMLQEKWPFLFQLNGMMNHFEELTKVKFDEQLGIFLEEEALKVMEFITVKKKKAVKKIKKELDKRVLQATEKGLDLKSPRVTGFLAMLSKYLNEDFNFLIRLIQKGTKEEDVQRETDIPNTPLIIVSGDNIYKPQKIFFSMDGFVHGTAKTMFEAVGLLFTSYYVFNLNYAPQVQISLEFIQRCIAMINPPRGNKRPGAEESRESGGQHSANTIHSALSKMTNLYEAFFAEREETEDSEESNASSVDSPEEITPF